jgi:hypothetical protein
VGLLVAVGAVAEEEDGRRVVERLLVLRPAVGETSALKPFRFAEVLMQWARRRAPFSYSCSPGPRLLVPAMRRIVFGAGSAARTGMESNANCRTGARRNKKRSA